MRTPNQDILVMYGQNGVPIGELIKDDSTLVFFKPLGDKSAYVYVQADSPLCKTLGSDVRFWEIEYSDTKFCQFGTHLPLTKMNEPFEAFVVKFSCIDPKSPKLPLKQLIGF